jgi:hypothetical protein
MIFMPVVELLNGERVSKHAPRSLEGNAAAG